MDLNALCNLCARIVSCSSELIFMFLHVDSKTQNASDPIRVYPPLFCNLCSPYKQPPPPPPPPPQKKREKKNSVWSVDSNSSISVTIQN